MVLNKPAGLAVQGGSGTTRHVDQMLEVMRDAKGQKPRLVHRLDKETSGCLLVAKTRFAATALTGAFRAALGAQDLLGAGRRRAEAEAGPHFDLSRASEESEDDTIMRVAKHGDEGASHAVTYYARGRNFGAEARLGVAEAGDGTDASAARAHGAYRPRHRRRSEIFQYRELATARRPAEPTASFGAAHRDPASARRRDRRDRAVAAAHAAIVELARARSRRVSIRSKTHPRTDAPCDGSAIAITCVAPR